MSNFFISLKNHKAGSGPKTGVFRKAVSNVNIVFIFFVIILLLVSCSQGAGSNSRSGVVISEETVLLPTSVPTLEPSPTNTRVLPIEVLTPALTPTITPIPDEVMGLVVDVIDGDTIAVVLDGDSARQAYQVRYLGIEAPENSSSNPWGVVAYEVNQRLAKLKIVRLVRDQTDFDAEGYLLRYVYIDNQLLSVVLAEQGLARAAIEAPNTRLEDEILAAEAQAREDQLGLWGPQPPTPTVTPGKPASSEEGEQLETPVPTAPTSANITPTVELTATSTITATIEVTPQATGENPPDNESPGQ